MDDRPVVTDSAGTPTLKRRLGRGLTALLGTADEGPLPVAGTDSGDNDAPSCVSDEIAVELIERNPFQPRTEFEEDSLLELSESIRQHGVLQPLLVRAGSEGYTLIAGERRWLAAQKAGLEAVPCRVLDLADQQASEVAIEENLKRRDLNALEKAAAFHEYMKRFDSTIEELAERLSMNRSTVSNTLRLLDLPESVKDALWADRISAGHARALLPLNEVQQDELCRRIQAEGLSVRRTEEAVRACLQQSSGESAGTPMNAPQKKTTESSNHVLSLQDQLRELLGMKVDIRLRSRQAGRVVVHFESNEDFERLFRSLRGAT